MILLEVRDNKSGRGQNRPDQYVFLLIMLLLLCGAFLFEPHELMKSSQCFYDSDHSCIQNVKYSEQFWPQVTELSDPEHLQDK